MHVQVYLPQHSMIPRQILLHSSIHAPMFDSPTQNMCLATPMHTALSFSRSFRYPFAILILIDFWFAEVHFGHPFLHGIHTLVSLSTHRLSKSTFLAPPSSPMRRGTWPRVLSLLLSFTTDNLRFVTKGICGV